MCGLFGVAGDLAFADKKILTELAVFNNLRRGDDSSGIAVVGSVAGDDPSITKTAGPVYHLFETLGWDKLSMYGKKAIIGHTRKATIGSVTKRNAHPFQYSHLTGVHNGTLKNWRQLPGVSEDIDSQTLYEVMSRLGTRDTIEQVDGAYALVWWDRDEATLNFLRNHERTLYYCFSDDFKRMFWASEAWMLHIAVGQHIKMGNLDTNSEYPVYVLPFETDQHFKVKIGAGKNPITFLEEDDNYKQELKGGVKKPYTPPFQGGQSRLPYRSPFHWEDAFDDDPDVTVVSQPKHDLPGSTSSAGAASSTTSTSPGSGTPGSSSTATRQPKPTLSLVHDSKKSGSEQSSDEVRADGTFDNEIVGYNGVHYTKFDYETKTFCECSFCSEDITWEDAKAGKIHRWIAADSMICTTCTTAC